MIVLQLDVLSHLYRSSYRCSAVVRMCGHNVAPCQLIPESVAQLQATESPLVLESQSSGYINNEFENQIFGHSLSATGRERPGIEAHHLKVSRSRAGDLPPTGAS